MRTSLLIGLLLLPALAFGEATDEQHRRERASWLQNHHIIQASDVPLAVEDWIRQKNLPYAKDSSLKELHVAVDTTEAKGRSAVERLCEAYPDTAGWTVYVRRPDGAFIFATTCPGGQG